MLIAVLVSSVSGGEDALVVHEWGTFTTLQNEAGQELSGINVDDEPVPEFVHNLNPYLLSNTVLSSQHWQYRQKAAPRRHPRVTMRLETPVIYFYPPTDTPQPQELDVQVEFRGGWLTEFYPEAEASAPGLQEGIFEFGELQDDTVGSLTWRNVRIGSEEPGPDTDQRVWLAPRKTASASLSVGSENEKYLFYRGVARQRPPLRVTTDRPADRIEIYGNLEGVLPAGERVTIGPLWLVHVLADGRAAYRILDSHDVTRDPQRPLAAASTEFSSSDYAPENLARLKAIMHFELVAAGLFADEATALLETWQRAYFTSPGLRLFFLVPRAWTDSFLPLKLTRNEQPVSAKIERVMMGRIELISREQRALLDQLAQAAISDGSWIDKIPASPARDAFLAGRSDFGDLSVPIPPDYQTYLELGRFRNALVVAEEQLRPTSALTQFIDTYGLHPYRWPGSQPEADATAVP